MSDENKTPSGESNNIPKHDMELNKPTSNASPGAVPPSGPVAETSALEEYKKQSRAELEAMYAQGNPQPFHFVKEDAPKTVETHSDTQKGMAATLGVQIPGAVPPSGPVAEILERGEDPIGRHTGSWIGQRMQKLLNVFLRQHSDAWHNLQADELDKAQTKAKFTFYSTRIAESQRQLADLQAEVDNAKTVSFPLTLFKNRVAGGKSFSQIFFGDAGSMLLATYFVQQFGPEMIALAQSEHAILEKDFREFKQSKRVVLKSIGLI